MSSTDTSISYAEEVKSELRRKDRRVASCIPNIFFKLKKTQIKRLLDTSNICLRRNKIQGTVTAGQVKTNAAIDRIIKHDDGFRAGKNIKGSPWYWDEAKKDLFAMIRQLEKPTYFMSLSCADTQWVDLLRLLGKSVDNVNYTDEELLAMSWAKKSDLIKKDLHVHDISTIDLKQFLKMCCTTLLTRLVK